MRFPFFATNRLVLSEKHLRVMWNADFESRLLELKKWVLDEQELRHKLEERVAKLEGGKAHGRKKGKQVQP